MENSDLDLMQKVTQRDSKALEVLYDRYSPILYSLIKRIVKDKEKAEEVLAEVFVIIWKKCNQFNFNTNNPFVWLISLAKNKATDFIRRDKGTIDTEYSDEYEDNFIIPTLSEIIDPLDYETAFSRKEELKQSLAKLTDAQRYVLNLAFYEGLTQTEISENLKIPLPTIRTKIKVALTNLRENLNQEASVLLEENKLNESLQAAALGCLDHADLTELNEYVFSDNFLVSKEYSEYQIISSLLPLGLESEIPDPEVKDNVARTLIKMEQELKAAKEEELQKTEITDMTPETTLPEISDEFEPMKVPETMEEKLDETIEEKSFDMVDEKLDKVESIFEQNTELIEETSEVDEVIDDVTEIEEQLDSSQEIIANATESSTESKFDRGRLEKVISELRQVEQNSKSLIEKAQKSFAMDYDNLKESFNRTEKKFTKGILLLIILNALLIAVMIFFYFKFSTDVNKLEEEIKQLKKSQTMELKLDRETKIHQYSDSHLLV